MSLNLDCRKLDADEDKAHCSVCGYICDCPAECSEYTNFFGKQPYKKKSPLEEISEQN